MFIILIFCALLSSCANQELKFGVDAFNVGNYDQAAIHWNPLATQGDPYAQYNLGLLWEDGLGSTEKNISEAANWYYLSAQQGYVPAMLRLANIQKANGFDEFALSWYVMAARWGNPDAVSALRAWGKPIPDPDLMKAQNDRNNEDIAIAVLAGVTTALVVYSVVNSSASGGSSNTNIDNDWEWDQFYNAYGELVWACRGVQTGEFAVLSKCDYKYKTDYTWPGK